MLEKNIRKHNLMMKLDNTLRNLLEEDVIDIHFSSIVDHELLDKCNYFTDFPNYLVQLSTLLDCNDLDDTKKMQKKNTKMLDKYLTPAVCLSFYPQLKNQNIQNDFIVSSISNAFRNEAEYVDGIRQLEYTIREFVFVGDKQFVKNKLDTLCDKALQYAKTISPLVEVKSATDCFFPSETSKYRERMQLVNKTKQELVASINGKEVALASFNFHGNHFSAKFNFEGGRNIVTGCVGFGLERWISFLEQNNK